MICADSTDMIPTGPSPTTATTSPGSMRARRAPYQAVGALSVSTSAASSLTPSGIATRLPSALGTATACAWLPGSIAPSP